MTDSEDRMLDLAFFRTSALENTPPGALFVPAAKGGEHFIAGRVNEFPVLVALESDSPFRLASPEQWSQGRGLIVEKIRFEVDKASATEIGHAQDAPRGALVLSKLGAMIIAYDDNGAQAVLLEGGSGSTAIDGTDPVAFSNWQIVAGAEPEVVMYRTPQAPV